MNSNEKEDIVIMANQTIGVIGAGAMGTGIANVAALNGCKVILQDINEVQLEQSLKQMDKFMSKSVERDKLTEDGKVSALEAITTTTDLNEMKHADIVIEAVIENMEVKQNVFKQLNDIVPASTILTTNTSSMSITEIASVVDHPERVAGMHFFNPAQLMKLVEVVRGYYTSDETVATLKALAEQLQKKVVEVKKDSPGFIVNRVMIPHFIEAIRLVEEGVASKEDVDMAVKYGLNYPMGPFELQDYAGVDIGYFVMNYFAEEFNDDRFAPPLYLKQMMKAKRYGKKSGAGFYDYEK